jgi:FlaA1/EpsC-like NDP-sugar epimerase
VIKEDVLKSFAGRNVLVTGGTGMIGRQIVDILCDELSQTRKRSMSTAI